MAKEEDPPVGYVAQQGDPWDGSQVRRFLEVLSMKIPGGIILLRRFLGLGFYLSGSLGGCVVKCGPWKMDSYVRISLENGYLSTAIPWEG